MPKEKKMTSGVLALRLEVPEGKEKQFSQWYEADFAPRYRTLPAVRAVRRFRALDGQPNSWVLVDVGDVAALRKAPGRRSRRASGIEADPFLSQLAPVHRGIYRQRYPQYALPGKHGFDFTRWVYEPPMWAQVLMTVGYDVPAREEAEFNAWYEEEHVPLVLSMPGILSARRFQLEEGTEGEPRYLALYDIATPYTFYSDAFVRVRHSPWLERVHTFAVRRYRGLYRRVT